MCCNGAIGTSACAYMVCVFLFTNHRRSQEYVILPAFILHIIAMSSLYEVYQPTHNAVILRYCHAVQYENALSKLIGLDNYAIVMKSATTHANANTTFIGLDILLAC